MQIFQLQGIACSHLVHAITDEVQAPDDATEVQVDRAPGKVQVESVLSTEQVLAAIRGVAV